MIYDINDNEFSRELVKYTELEENMIYHPAVYLFSSYAKNLNSLYKWEEYSLCQQLKKK